MEWTAKALLDRLDSEPDLRIEDLIRQRAVELNRSYRSAMRDFQILAADPKYRQRFEAHAGEVEEDLTYGFPEPDPADRKQFWLWNFLRTRNQNQACSISGVRAQEVQRWFSPGSNDYDEAFAADYREACARVVMAHEDDIQTARKMALATGDAKTLAMISTRALESLNSAKWGRSRLEISGAVEHVHKQIGGATHSQLAERAQRLLGTSDNGDEEVVEAEYEELPS